MEALDDPRIASAKTPPDCESVMSHGSSMYSTSGSAAKAWAISTRCFMPPESSRG